MELRLGISTGFAIKRWADPEKLLPFVKEELGLSTIQFSFDQFDPRGVEESVKRYCSRFREACEQHNITIHSTFTGLSIYSHNLLYHPLPEGRKDGFHWFEKAFEMTELLGVQATGGPFGGMDLASFADPDMQKYLQQEGNELIIQLLRKAKKHGINDFYWEQTPVLREGAVDIKGTKQFIENLNKEAGPESARLSLCFDVGHTTHPSLTQSEKIPYQWIEPLKNEINLIHLQQTDGFLDRHWAFTDEHNGSGIIEPSNLFDQLEAAGIQSMDLFLEIGHPFEEDDQKVINELKESIDFWRQALLERSVTV